MHISNESGNSEIYIHNFFASNKSNSNPKTEKFMVKESL